MRRWRKVRMRKRKVPRFSGAMSYVRLPCFGCEIFLSRTHCRQEQDVGLFLLSYCSLKLSMLSSKFFVKKTGCRNIQAFANPDDRIQGGTVHSNRLYRAVRERPHFLASIPIDRLYSLHKVTIRFFTTVFIVSCSDCCCLGICLCRI